MQTRQEDRRTSPCKKFSKLVYPKQTYSDFSNFQNGCCHHLLFLKSRNFIGYWGREGRDASACQISSKSVAKIIRFFNFSRWRPPPSSIVEFANFIGWQCPHGPDASLYQISSKWVFSCGDIASFWIFKMAAVLWVIGVQMDETHQHAKFYQNWSIGCEDIKICQDGECPPSWIRLWHIWTTHSEYLWVSSTLQNLVMIDAVVFQYLTRLAGKCLFTPPKIGGFGQFNPLNGLQYQPKPKNAYPCVSSRHMSH